MLALVISASAIFGQAGKDFMTITRVEDITELHGVILDGNTEEALPYANIYVVKSGKGAISNEIGQFTVDVSALAENDTIRFQYIGYKTRGITLGDLQRMDAVLLSEEIINLSELIVFGDVPDLKTIVKNILVYKDSNYRKTTSKKQSFMREREVADLSNFKLKFKKSSIDELGRETIQDIEDRTPDLVTSYTDFLGNVYLSNSEVDSVKPKIDPIRLVALKEDYLDDLAELEKLFENVLADTEEDEYWKVKSGIFGQKLDFDEEVEESPFDSLKESRWKTAQYEWQVDYQLAYTSLDSKEEWEFLHKPGKYKYSLAGGTVVNGEQVYIIDFEPSSSGMYAGRMFVAMQTYALVRADYDYAPGKMGRDFHLLGLGYTENQFSGSIYFEKKGDNYFLKYFSKRQGFTASIDRSLALMKKRKRWLFDRKLKELKLRLDFLVKVEESIEYLVIDDMEISSAQFDNFEQPEYMDVIFVDQFDEDLWRGYAIIEPTQQMKEYKKQLVSNPN
jgi:hypothetical protein